MRAWIMAAGIAAAAGVTGCAGARLVAARAADDLGCPEKQIKVEGREMGSYEASGCGKHMSYTVRAGEVLPDNGGELGGD